MKVLTAVGAEAENRRWGEERPLRGRPGRSSQATFTVLKTDLSSGTRWAGRSSQGSRSQVLGQHHNSNTGLYISQWAWPLRETAETAEAGNFKPWVAGAVSTPGKGQELVLGLAGASRKAFVFQLNLNLVRDHWRSLLSKVNEVWNNQIVVLESQPLKRRKGKRQTKGQMS